MILLFILVWGMFAGWTAHLLVARNQPINWAELLVVGLAGSFVGGLLISLLSGDGLALRPGGPSGQSRAAGPDSSAASNGRPYAAKDLFTRQGLRVETSKGARDDGLTGTPSASAPSSRTIPRSAEGRR
jgi:uncharacterized membrane protein YeaQ/YmgE (transglycosylase-associated protein family)